MSLDTVAEDIRDEARARADEIRREAEERAEDIVAEAEADAERIVEEREAEVESTVEQEREQTLSSAKLEAKQERLSARRDVLAETREATEAALADLEGDRREELTDALLASALEEFEGERAVVRGRPDDAGLIRSLVESYDGAEYGGEYDCLGGVVVQGEESRVRVNNTFDSVLDEVWNDELKQLSERLFDQ